MGADLRNCNFRKKDLTGANFMGADLRGCDFSEATLVQTNLKFARFGQTQKQIWIELAIALLLALPMISFMSYAVVIDDSSDYLAMFWVPIATYFLFSWADQRHFSHLVYFRLLIWLFSLLIPTVLGMTGFLAILSTPWNLFVVMILFTICFYFSLHFIDTQFRSHTHPRPGTRFINSNLREAQFESLKHSNPIQHIDFTGANLEQIDFSKVVFNGIRCDYYYTSYPQTDHTRVPQSNNFTPLQAKCVLENLSTISK